jgi:hypothetical protein
VPAITTELQYDYKSDKYFRSKFYDDVSEEKHEKYLDYAGFPTFISYKGNMSEVSCPRLENDFGEKDVQLWKMVNHYSWWGLGSAEEKVTPWKTSVSEIKTKIIRQSMIVGQNVIQDHQLRFSETLEIGILWIVFYHT